MKFKLREYLTILKASNPNTETFNVSDFPELEPFEKEILDLQPIDTTERGKTEKAIRATTILKHFPFFDSRFPNSIAFAFFPKTREFYFRTPDEVTNVERMTIFVQILEEQGYLKMKNDLKPKNNFYLTYGNHKLSKKIVIFTLPAGVTCPGKGECAKWCYSQKAQKLYPRCLEARTRNFEATKSPSFVERMSQRLMWEVRHGRTICRIHEDGDFYNYEYLLKWEQIAKKVPRMTFFVYTKSLHLLPASMPRNVILFQSYGSCFDYRIDPRKNTARVIQEENQVAANEYLCPYHKHQKGFKCGCDCIYCMDVEAVERGEVRHVAFVKH